MEPRRTLRSPSQVSAVLDEAVTQARRTLELDPRFGIALFWLEGSLRHQGLLKEAVALRQRVSTPERAQILRKVDPDSVATER